MKKYIHSDYRPLSDIADNREDSKERIAEWYDDYTINRYYPESADKFKIAEDIFWNKVNMEDVPLFLENFTTDELEEIDEVRYFTDDQIAEAEKQGFEDGHIVTYKDGSTKYYAWLPYPRNYEPMEEIEL